MRLQQQVMRVIGRWRGAGRTRPRQATDLDAVVAHYAIGAVLCTDQGVIRAVNHHFEALTGFSRDELVDLPAPVLRSGLYNSSLLDGVLSGVAQHGLWQGRLYSRHKSGRLLAEHLTICRYQGDEPLLLSLVGVSHQEAVSAAVEQQGVRMLDPLTGLLDRPGFYAELEQCCSHGMPFGLLSLDLKNFCQINTQFDHHTGDVLLQQLADRLRLLVGSRELIGRVGGDEIADGSLVHRGVLADRGVRAATGLDAHDALRIQRPRHRQQALVFLRVDVVGDDDEVPALAHRLAQHLDQRGLAGADRPADTYPQRRELLGATGDRMKGAAHGGKGA